jgi:hypothetical protein
LWPLDGHASVQNVNSSQATLADPSTLATRGIGSTRTQSTRHHRDKLGRGSIPVSVGLPSYTSPTRASNLSQRPPMSMRVMSASLQPTS